MFPGATQHQLDQIAELCRRFDVARLELFGSAANGTFDPATSDLDFLATFHRHPLGSSPSKFERYFGFREGLEALFGRPIDVVEPHTVRNPVLLRTIETSKKLLYAA